MNGLVIVGCGAGKLDRPAPANQMYTGTHFRLCYRAATALAPTRGVLILSAKYGLIEPETVIEPYDLRMGRAGSVSLSTVYEQARALGVTDERRVFVFAGSAYVQVIGSIWPQIRTPLSGLQLGRRYQVLNAIAATRDPWAKP